MPPSKLSLISNEDFTRFISNSTTWPQVINKCGFFTTSCPKVKERAMAMKLNVSHIIEGRKKGPNKMKMISDSTFKELVSTSQNWNDVARKIGFKVTNTSGGAGMWCKARAIKMGLNIAHVRGLKPFSDLKSPRRNVCTLRRKLKDAGILEICSWCRCEHMELDDGKWLWFGRELRLQIDHIHGRSNPPCEKDDDVNNLRFLCYNCHSQTPNCTLGYKINPKTRSNSARQILLRSGKEYICEMCKCEHMEKGFNGAWEWRGWMLNLQCEHIDGDHNNDELSNLTWLCPCCHSTTDTFCGRNNKRKRQQREEQSV